MNGLRRWELTAADPYCAILAADSRLTSTDYLDDQSWELKLGQADAPALAFSTRYGGRVGQASLVPMVTLAGQPPIYAAQDFASPMVLTAVAPGYARADALLTPTLGLSAEYFIFESHAAGGRFAFSNHSDAPVNLRLDVVGFVASEGAELRLGLVTTETGHALTLGKAGSVRPVLLIEGGAADGVSGSRIGISLTVPAQGTAVARWAHGGLRSAAASIALAQRWLARDWDAVLDRAARAQDSVPQIETGDSALDALLAASYMQLVQSFLNPAGALPMPSPVGTRHPGRGFSAHADGSDHPRAWAGQAPTLIYPLALAAAQVDAKLAEGIVRNLLAVQREDGAIDWRPGLGGQAQGLLFPPLLARLAWGVFQFTENDGFLRDIFPGLLRFLRRWQQPGLDRDGDGLPEWQSDVQTGYPFFPTFGHGYAWAQNASIRTAETPDLAAYLLSEAVSLREIAFYLRETDAEAECAAYAERMAAALESLWTGERYAYRDRDTHTMQAGRALFSDAPGHEPLFLAEPLDPPARLLITVQGGAEHTPQLKLTLQGEDAHGQPVSEVITPDRLIWTYGRGVATTQTVFRVLNSIHPEGLSRVFRLGGAVVDWTRRDINGLLPLWSPGLPDERAQALISYYAAVLRVTNGVTMVATDDPAYKPDHKDGAGGVWPYWLTLIGEGLIEAGHADLAYDLVQRLMRAQTTALTANKAFSEYMHAERPEGLGELGHVGGIAPLYLFLRLAGVRVISARKVWTGGPFPMAAPMTVRRFGVAVTRSADGTDVQFPSGRRAQLPADAPLTEIADVEEEAIHHRDAEDIEGV